MGESGDSTASSDLVRRTSRPKKKRQNRYELRPYTRKPAPYEPSRAPDNNLLFYCGQEGCNWVHQVASNFRKHLKSKHDIDVKPEASQIAKVAQNLVGTFVRDSNNDAGVRTPLTEDVVRQAMVYYVVRNSEPFSIIEAPSLQYLLLTMNPYVQDLLTTSRRTLVNDIRQTWLKEKEQLKNRLRDARTKIHISLDIWTSPNTYLFIGVIAHYVASNEDQISTSLLALREVGGHSGEEQWSILRTILEEYEIIDRLGCIIADSASTNGTLCRTIHNYFSEELMMVWDYERNQIRCICHIFNLIVQAFLFGNLEEQELEAYDQQEKEREDVDISAQQQVVREQMSSLGKLHNIVAHIRRSGGRTKEFETEAGGRIPLDNRTRWNSWYMMLERAISYEKSIDFYLKNHPELRADILKPKDWDILRTISHFLSRFHSQSKQLESNSDDISQVLPHLWHVRLWIKANKDRFARKDGQPASRTTAEEKDFLNRLKNAEIAFQKWWDLLWGNTTYILATLLNPIYRTTWFKNALPRIDMSNEAIKKALDRAHTAYDTWHTQRQEEESLERRREIRIEPKRRRTTYHLRTKGESIYEMNERVLGSWETNEVSEYVEYINQPPTKAPAPDPNKPDDVRRFKPLAWWCEESQQAKWPHLSSLAISILSFPATSAEPERVFSGARRTISWERSQLTPAVIEILECLKFAFRTKERLMLSGKQIADIGVCFSES